MAQLKGLWLHQEMPKFGAIELIHVWVKAQLQVIIELMNLSQAITKPEVMGQFVVIITQYLYQEHATAK